MAGWLEWAITNPAWSASPAMKLPRWLQRMRRPRREVPPEIGQARALIAAIDAGGVPTNPLRVNAIARALGLEVSTRAPMAQTIVRIREALGRLPHGGR